MGFNLAFKGLTRSVGNYFLVTYFGRSKPEDGERSCPRYVVVYEMLIHATVRALKTMNYAVIVPFRSIYVVLTSKI